MPATSGTFEFQSITVELIIREAYERIGILGEFVEAQKLESAKRSIDFLMLEWMSKSVNLWTLEKAYLPLITGQADYILPNNVSDIVQVNNRTSTRLLDGTAASSAGGVAANAFDGNPNTACTQNAADGNISYDYGVGTTQQVTFVGIQTNATTLYSLVVEYSLDGINWANLFTIKPQIFSIGVNVWFDVNTPVNARSYRIRETGGATLNIQEIYFNNNVFDLAISNISRYEYFTYPQKYLQSRPSTYYLDRQFNAPVLSFWPTPSNMYNCVQYTYKKMIQDVGLFYTNAVQIPSRFYPALVWGLSWHLALKFNPNIAEMMKGEYERAFSTATIEDSEQISIGIYADYSGDY